MVESTELNDSAIQESSLGATIVCEGEEKGAVVDGGRKRAKNWTAA